MNCTTVTFTGHALSRMFERSLSQESVVAAILHGEVIADYPGDRPYPTSLLFRIVDSIPVHVVVARDKKDYACYVVTAYIPDARLWGADFKTRKH